jgi:hypothetical protein
MALALIWGYDLNYYTIAYLGHSVPEDLVMLGALPRAWRWSCSDWASAVDACALSPSRAVAFQSLVLLVIGVYLILMVGAAQSVAWLGGNASALVQLGFAFATTVAIIAAVPSSRLRRWLNVVLAKHFFQHRYDYRAEWLRFTRTIGRAGPNAQPLHARLVQAVADITDGARGLLLVPGEGGDWFLPRWQWPTLEVPASALPQDAVAFLERRGFIVDLDQIRAGTDFEGEAAIVPGWMIAEEAIWVLVPLIHFDRLVGLVVLGRPLSHASSTGRISTSCAWSGSSLQAILQNTAVRSPCSRRAGSTNSTGAWPSSCTTSRTWPASLPCWPAMPNRRQSGLSQRHAGDAPQCCRQAQLIARLSRYGSGRCRRLSRSMRPT